MCRWISAMNQTFIHIPLLCVPNNTQWWGAGLNKNCGKNDHRPSTNACFKFKILSSKEREPQKYSASKHLWGKNSTLMQRLTSWHFVELGLCKIEISVEACDSQNSWDMKEWGRRPILKQQSPPLSLSLQTNGFTQLGSLHGCYCVSCISFPELYWSWIMV